MEDYKGLSKNTKGPQTKRLQKIFELATQYAEKLNLKEVEEENLMTAILNSGFSTAVRIISIRIPNIKSFKEVIYKTFAKSLNKCKELKNEEQRQKEKGDKTTQSRRTMVRRAPALEVAVRKERRQKK